MTNPHPLGISQGLFTAHSQAAHLRRLNRSDKQCPKCGDFFNSGGLAQHYPVCDGTPQQAPVFDECRCGRRMKPTTADHCFLCERIDDDLVELGTLHEDPVPRALLEEPKIMPKRVHEPPTGLHAWMRGRFRR